MAVSGWYPDPSGAPGRYRYWDGTRWSAETTDDPGSPPPFAGADPSADGRSGRGRSSWVAIAAVLIVIVVLAVLAVRAFSNRGQALADPDPPSSTVSGWDDSSPLPTASPTPTPSRTPSPTASHSPQPKGQVACATGQPDQRQPYPNDGRIHGGGLSFSSPGWEEADWYAQQMDWAYDVGGVMEETEPTWAALMAVGAVHTDDGFRTPRQSADGMMQCIASSAYYSDFSGRKDVFSRSITVDGHQGWALRSEILVDNPGLSVPGDTAEVIVINTGTPGQLSFFAGFVPIGDDHRTQLLDQAIADLRTG